MLGAFLLFVCNRIFVVSFFGVRARDSRVIFTRRLIYTSP